MKAKTQLYLVVLAIAALLVLPLAGYAGSPSPFVGEWRAVDVDGSDIRLTIAGPPGGPFEITSTESYISFCDREAGIVRGTGWPREGDPNVLEADLHLECFTTGASLDFHAVWHYDAATGTLSSRDAMFYRPGRPQPVAPGRQIIAHPDEDWVEGWGFDEGALVSLRIFDADGVLLYADSAVASYPEWDPDHACVEFAVGYDLKAGDHLWMTDGATAKDLFVTNLEITDVNLTEQTVSGVAEPGSQVTIEYYPEMLTVTADQDGNWTATVPELTPGVAGLASQDDEDGDLTRVVFLVPGLDLRVNYGHDWVESFFEAGHTVWVTVTESDGVTVKATAELVTEPKDSWGGEPGFQTQPSDWVPSPPDIQPYDWVFGRVDSGQTAQVQIGDISGEIDLEADSIQGTITAPWFSSEVEVEFHPWGAPGPAPMKHDTVLPDGVDTYLCAWDPSSEWDIQAGQDVGVGYFGPDGHWVANAFQVPPPPNLRFTAFPEWEYIEGWEWPLGAAVHLAIDDPGTPDMPDYEQDGTVEITPWDPNTTWVTFNFAGAHDLKPGDLVTLSDGVTTRTHVVRNLAITAADAAADTVSGTADAGTVVHVWAHGFDEVQATASDDGTWLADFAAIPFDLTGGMDGRSEIRDEAGNGTAVDWWIAIPD